MADTSHDRSPPFAAQPPALFDTSTEPSQNVLPISLNNLTSNPLNSTTSSPTRPSSSNTFPSSEKPWHCTECTAVSTPLRRRGPQGRQTLCNACGIRYAKRMREAGKAIETNSYANQQTVPVRNTSQCVTTKLPHENEADVRKRGGSTPKSNKRHKYRKLSEGQYFIASLHAATQGVRQLETDLNSVSFNEGIGMSLLLRAAVTQEPTTLTLTADANPTQADHLTLSSINTAGLMKIPDPPVASPPIPAMSTYPRESFPKGPTLVDQAAFVNAPVFFGPGEHAGMDCVSGESTVENAIIREDVEPVQAVLQHVDNDTTCLHTVQGTSESEELPIAREMNSTILESSQRSTGQAPQTRLLRDEVAWSDDFARGYGVTVPATQKNTQIGYTQERDMTSVDAGATGHQRTFGEEDRETLVMRYRETLSRLVDMSNKIAGDINSLSERITRFARKNEELVAERQQNVALIEQLRSEKTMANTKHRLLCDDITKIYCVLEHLRQQE